MSAQAWLAGSGLAFQLIGILIQISKNRDEYHAAQEPNTAGEASGTVSGMARVEAVGITPSTYMTLEERIADLEQQVHEVWRKQNEANRERHALLDAVVRAQRTAASYTDAAIAKHQSQAREAMRESVQINAYALVSFVFGVILQGVGVFFS